ncbi:MAG: thioredoxin family protein [Gaiellaceae bacterium MAG52_C11]|nr:thioredoxin family protein [Candidatus Gaiellasilicea maunaloa]
MTAIHRPALLAVLVAATVGCGGESDVDPMDPRPAATVLAVSGDFDALVTTRSSEEAVAVLFTAPWSGPDRVFKPIVNDVLRERSGEFDLVLVDVDRHPRVAERFKILSIPTLAVFRDGILVDRAVGALPEEDVNRFLDATLRESPRPD